MWQYKSLGVLIQFRHFLGIQLLLFNLFSYFFLSQISQKNLSYLKQALYKVQKSS